MLPRPVQAIIVNSYSLLVNSEVPILNKAFFLVGACLLGSQAITAVAAINFLAIAKIAAFISATAYFSELIFFRLPYGPIHDARWLLTLNNLRTHPHRIFAFFRARFRFFDSLLTGRRIYGERLPRFITAGMCLLIYFSAFSYLRIDILLQNTGLFTPAFAQNIALIPFSYLIMALTSPYVVRIPVEMPRTIFTTPHRAFISFREELVHFTNCLLNEASLDQHGPEARVERAAGLDSNSEDEHIINMAAPLLPHNSFGQIRAAAASDSDIQSIELSDSELTSTGSFAIDTAQAQRSTRLFMVEVSESDSDEEDTMHHDHSPVEFDADEHVIPGTPTAIVQLDLPVLSVADHSDHEEHNHGAYLEPHEASQCSSVQCASGELARQLTVTDPETSEAVILCGAIGASSVGAINQVTSTRTRKK